MGVFAKLFKKNSEGTSSKNVEDFVSLTRVYFQSVIAANLGITNIRFVPDVANFKRLFKIFRNSRRHSSSFASVILAAIFLFTRETVRLRSSSARRYPRAWS